MICRLRDADLLCFQHKIFIAKVLGEQEFKIFCVSDVEGPSAYGGGRPSALTSVRRAERTASPKRSDAVARSAKRSRGRGHAPIIYRIEKVAYFRNLK